VPPAAARYAQLQVLIENSTNGTGESEIRLYEVAVFSTPLRANDLRGRQWYSDSIVPRGGNTSLVLSADGKTATLAGGELPDICPVAWEMDFDRAQLTTQVEIGRETPSIPPQTYTLSAGTGAPAFGEVTLSSADQQGATRFRISTSPPSGGDIGTFLTYVKQGGTIRINDANDTGNKYRAYLVTGEASVTGGYYDFPVMWTDGETAVPNGGITVMLNISAERPTFVPDQAAINAFGIETFSRTDLLNSSTVVFQTLAQRWIAIRGITSMPRVESVMLNAATGGNDQRRVMEIMATAAPEEPSRYRCRLKTHSGRQVFDRIMFATEVRHFLSRDEWTTRIGLDAAEWAERL
jgi:hypothetical protein